MASLELIVQDLMTEFGTVGHDARLRLERFAGEVVLNILNQNSSRFRRLQKRITLTFNKDDTQKKLPADFKTHRGELVEVDSDNLFIAEFDVLDDTEFFSRKADTSRPSSTYFRIETLQAGVATPGEYLIVNAKIDETRFFQVPYFRTPDENDTDIIDDAGIIKEGVRAKVLTGDESIKHLRIYETSKKDLIEHPGERATAMVLRPNKRQQNLNRQMFKIGRGQ